MMKKTLFIILQGKDKFVKLWKLIQRKVKSEIMSVFMKLNLINVLAFLSVATDNNLDLLIIIKLFLI